MLFAVLFITSIPDAHIVTTTSTGNGGKPVLVVVADAFDDTRPAQVQTHYHGDNATALAGEQIARINELIHQDPQRVFVLPEAAGNVGSAPTDWSNVSDQALTTREALSAAGVLDVDEFTLSAHSAGGRALARALKNDGNVLADRVVLLDCLYEPAATTIKEGLLEHVQAEVIVVRGTNQEERTRKFAETFNTTPIVMAEHEATVRYVLDGRI